MLVSARTKITIAAACAIHPWGFLAASRPRTWRAAASQTATPPRLLRADDRNLKGLTDLAATCGTLIRRCHRRRCPRSLARCGPGRADERAFPLAPSAIRPKPALAIAPNPGTAP